MSEHDSHEDSALSALYRRVSREEPSSQLDERVMALAQRHAARRPQRWWLPLSTAAVVVLAVSLLLRHQQTPDELQRQLTQFEPTTGAAAPEPAPAPELPAAPEASVVPQSSAAPAATEPAVPRKPVRAMAKSEQAAKAVAAEAPVIASSEEEATTTQAPPLEATRDMTPAAEAMAEGAPATATADLAEQQPEAAQAEAKPAERARSMAPQAAPAAKRRAAVEAAEPWLKRIEALREKGELEAVRRELAAFRAAYPDYTLPKELQGLLPEAVK